MNEQLTLSLIFVAGYLCIALEASIRINKAASAIITGIICWTIIIINSDHTELINSQLDHHLSQISGILFFLLGAMTIVELVDMHNGFGIIAKYIEANKGKKLLWLIGFTTFFLSSVLDNLTTTIIMISLLAKVIKDRQTRLVFVSVVVIAANAGGAWTPIGDVTTTMLWIGGQITTVPLMTKLFLPSIACLITPLLYFHFKLKINPAAFSSPSFPGSNNQNPRGRNVLGVGIFALLFVPVFKAMTGLPPYMGILFGLAILWIYTELTGKDKNGTRHTISDALQKIDTTTVLFFLGILLSVAALQQADILNVVSTQLSRVFISEKMIVSVIGLISSIVDNVPLVAAAKGMYKMNQYAANSDFWILLAYCAGTGGNILIIGSAAGIAAMGKEKIGFFWYLKNISLIALVSYLAGIIVFILQKKLLDFF